MKLTDRLMDGARIWFGEVTEDAGEALGRAVRILRSEVVVAEVFLEESPVVGALVGAARCLVP